MNKHIRNSFFAVPLIAVLSFLLAMLLSLFGPVQLLELRFHDKLFDWRGPLPVEESPVVLVDMGQQADEGIPEQFPWPRDVYARAVENLNKAGARTIVFDVVFDQADPENDSLFASAIEKHGNVILAGDFEQRQNRNASSLGRIFPNERLREANPNRTGLVRMPADRDRGVRRYPLQMSVLEGLSGDQSYFWLGIEGLRHYLGVSYDSLQQANASSDADTFNLGAYAIPHEGRGSFIINYYGAEGLFPTVSFEEVIDDSSYVTVTEAEAFDINSFDDPDYGLLQRGVFEDKLVIIGATLLNLGDFHITPYNGGENPRPGFEVHAHAIQTILDGAYISRLNDLITLGIMMLFCLFIPAATRKMNVFFACLMIVGVAAVYMALTYVAFTSYNSIWMLTGPILAVVISGGGTIAYDFILTQRDKQRITGMFSSYVSPRLVEQMVESGEEPSLGGEEVHITAFFSDIQSFSTFSEQLEANKLVELINEYLNAMTNILNEQGGTLDKYIGDAIVGFFGAPVPVEQHALKGCIASQLMQKKQAELREKWAAENWPDIVSRMQTRIGLNTGKMVTGNMGSLRRFNYTMMGDNVNLAARCESGAKQYGVYTMVTGATRDEAVAAGDDCVFRLLDNIVVKGRTQPVRVYEVAALRADADDRLLECIDLYEQGLEAYFSQNWDVAKNKFEASAALEQYEQNPSGIFIRRCEQMREEPPGEDWDGVFVMKSK